MIEYRANICLSGKLTAQNGVQISETGTDSTAVPLCYANSACLSQLPEIQGGADSVRVKEIWHPAERMMQTLYIFER